MENSGHARAREILSNRHRLLSDLAGALGRAGMLDETALALFASRGARDQRRLRALSIFVVAAGVLALIRLILG
jgi:hypothetical protein